MIEYTVWKLATLFTKKPQTNKLNAADSLAYIFYLLAAPGVVVLGRDANTLGFPSGDKVNSSETDLAIAYPAFSDLFHVEWDVFFYKWITVNYYLHH